MAFPLDICSPNSGPISFNCCFLTVDSVHFNNCYFLSEQTCILHKATAGFQRWESSDVYGHFNSLCERSSKYFHNIERHHIQRRQRIRVAQLTQNSICCLRSVVLSKMAPGWRGEELLNKFIIFVFFSHKKYSRSFVKLRLNHWCHMDYFNDFLATFLDCGSILAVCGRVRDLLEFIKNLILCSKMNEGLTGLERHEGE